MNNYLKCFMILMIAVMLTGCAAHSPNKEAKDQWSNAILITPDETGKRWEEEIVLSDDVTVLMKAQSGIFGFVKILYSDEKTERYVYKFSGYSNVQEIRIEYDNTKLLVFSQTTCTGILSDKECSVLIIYDLENRTLLETIELDSDGIQIDEVSVD